MAAHMLVLYLFGILIRYSCISSSIFRYWISTKVEINTPLNSWKRVQDGVFMQRYIRLPQALFSSSPYEGDVFHEPPLLLFIFKYLIAHLEAWIPLIFVVLDVISAVLLSNASRHTVHFLFKEQQMNYGLISPKSSNIILKIENVNQIPYYVALMYLCNPLSIMSCAAMTTTVLENFLISWTYYAMISGQFTFSVMLVGLAAYQSLYPIMLIVPIILFFGKEKERGMRNVAFQSLMILLIELVVLLYSSYRLMNYSWQFLDAVYGFILTVPDLTPNIGFYWYFVMENFDHFGPFFLFVFQVNVFIYAVPLGFRLRHCPPFLFTVLVVIIAIGKSYPCIGDIALYSAMIPSFAFLVPFMRNMFMSACIMLCATLITPIMWQLWIYQGSANANFYFASTLLISFAQIFFIGDFVIGFVRWEYDLIHGPKAEGVHLYLS